MARCCSSRISLLAVCLALLLSPDLVSSGQVPGPAAASNIPVSSRDRLYLSDQSSNAVTVIDPAAAANGTGALLGVIPLGGKLSETLSAVYRGQSLVHGMGYAPDFHTIGVVAVASNAVVFISTAYNSVKHVEYVGRAPHEVMWRPDGREIWVTVRGADYIQVLDGRTFKPTRRVQVPNGPGMVIFSPNGKLAYVCSSFTPETVVIDTATYATVGRVKQASVFCPNIAASPDGTQVWFTLKDSGRVQVFDARPPFKPLAVLETGPITNHVNFAVTAKGQYAYVTVGGLRQVQVYTTGAAPKRVATIPTGDNPHGLWPSGDGTRMMVGLQLANAVAVIDTASNKVLSTIDVGGEAPMALMYVPRAIPEGSTTSPTANLVPASEARQAARALHIELVAAAGSGSSGSSKQVLSSVTLNSQGEYSDSLEAALTGLAPGQHYVLGLAESRDGAGGVEPLASFVASKDGAASVAVLGPFRSMLLGGSGSSRASKKQQQSRFLAVAPLTGSGDSSRVGAPLQVQQEQPAV